MNFFYVVKRSVVLITFIGNSMLAQQLEQIHAARAKETFPSARLPKNKAGTETKDGDRMDEAFVSAMAEASTSEEPALKVSSIVTEYIPNRDPQPVMKPQHLGNTPIFISVVQKGTNKTLKGTVKIFDRENKKLLGGVKTNSYCTIPDPKSISGDIIMLVSSFGFTDAMQHMNYYETERDTLKPNVTLFGNFFMLTFELQRINQTTLSGVYFLDDAAVMVPESKNQLNEVRDMLNENPQMKIRLEGHTNGETRGDIITMGRSKNYFGLKGDEQTRKGSAKELSQARAEAIKSWLMDQGIEGTRIVTVGWGGDKPKYHASSPFARRNSRVEVIVEE